MNRSKPGWIKCDWCRNRREIEKHFSDADNGSDLPPVRPSDDEIARLRAGHRRYEIARKMNPQQWAAAWNLNIKTGKPFDQIIDEVAPFCPKGEDTHKKDTAKGEQR